jgi:hypothetical protein
MRAFNIVILTAVFFTANAFAAPLDTSLLGKRQDQETAQLGQVTEQQLKQELVEGQMKVGSGLGAQISKTLSDTGAALEALA